MTLRKAIVEIGPNGLPCRIVKTARQSSRHYSLDENEAIMDRRRAVQQIRLQVWQRAGGECEYCGQTVTINGFHMHEEKPRGKGGEISLENSRCLCADCHLNLAHGSRRPRFGRRAVEVDADDLTTEPPYIATEGGEIE